MRRSIFWLNYALLVVVQLLLSNFLRVSPYIMLTILPFMVLCISIRVGTVGAMFIAAATGLVVDFLTEACLIEGYCAIETRYNFDSLTPEMVYAYDEILAEQGITPAASIIVSNVLFMVVRV